MRPHSKIIEREAWHKLINAAVNSVSSKSFNVSLKLDINGETWDAYGAEVSYRDILFFCKQGSATYVVDTYGDRKSVV